MCGKCFLVDSREERATFINESSSEGVKRFESCDCSTFWLGEGFEMSSLDILGLGVITSPHSDDEFVSSAFSRSSKADRNHVGRKSFVKNLPEHSALALIRAMLGIATSLDITPLAEGIETNEQYQLLKSLGCKLGQGYLFSPPVPAEQFAEILMKQNLN